MRELICFIFVLGAVNEALAQSPTPTVCPSVTVSCPSVAQPSAEFTATVFGANANQPFAYHWKVSNGKIVSGQGTPVIKVIGEPPFTATVQLTGLPSACTETIASCSILGGHNHVPPVRKIDEFGSISFPKLKPHLDKLVFQLRNTPGAQGYILSSGKWILAKKAIRYFVINQNIERGRVVYVQKKETGPLLVKLYLVPPGASPPG